MHTATETKSEGKQNWNWSQIKAGKTKHAAANRSRKKDQQDGIGGTTTHSQEQ